MKTNINPTIKIYLVTLITFSKYFKSSKHICKQNIDRINNVKYAEEFLDTEILSGQISLTILSL